MIIQKRVKGGRAALPASVLKSIWREVDRQSRRFNVSRSFVIATALAHTFGINEQEDYKTAGEEKIKLIPQKEGGLMEPTMKNIDDAFLAAIKMLSDTSSGNDAQLLDLIRTMTKTILLLEERLNILEQYLKSITEHIVAIVVADAMEGGDNGPVN